MMHILLCYAYWENYKCWESYIFNLFIQQLRHSFCCQEPYNLMENSELHINFIADDKEITSFWSL